MSLGCFSYPEMILTILTILLTLGLVICILNRKKTKVVKFIGPRGTGKTATLNALTGVDNKTVPTLESYSVLYKGITIYDIIERDGAFFERYGVGDRSALYFFFVKNIKDMDGFPDTKGFDMKFVYYGSLNTANASKKNLIVLNENPMELAKYLH